MNTEDHVFRKKKPRSTVFSNRQRHRGRVPELQVALPATTAKVLDHLPPISNGMLRTTPRPSLRPRTHRHLLHRSTHRLPLMLHRPLLPLLCRFPSIHHRMCSRRSRPHLALRIPNHQAPGVPEVSLTLCRRRTIRPRRRRMITSRLPLWRAAPDTQTWPNASNRGLRRPWDTDPCQRLPSSTTTTDITLALASPTPTPMDPVQPMSKRIFPSVDDRLSRFETAT